MGEALGTWFAREILAHEGPLVRYLTRTWRSRDEVPDLLQETYLRVYEASAKERPDFAKAFLFTTARHLIADRLRRKRIVSMEAEGDIDSLNVLVDEISPERSAGADEDLRSLTRAFDLLPPRCRQVVWMRRVEGRSQKEVAAQLGIGEAMVEKHIAKGMRRLADILLGIDSFKANTSPPGVSVKEGHYEQRRQD